MRVRRVRPSTAGAVLLLLVHAAFAWLGRAFSINTGNDDAAYLLLARALRDFSYRDSYLLGSPMHSQYPPGFPAILAVASAPFGERLDVILAVILLFSIAALALLFDVVRRQHGATVALCVLALCALNPHLLDHAGSIASEAPYLFFSVLAVWLTVREGAPPAATASPRWPVLVGAAAVCAAMTRSIGVTMIAALLLTWILDRRYRRAAVLAGGVALTAGSWLAWTILAPGQVVGRSYIADATFGGGGGDRAIFEVLIDRLVNSLPAYLGSRLPSALAQPSFSSTLLDNLLGAVLVLGLGMVGARILWKSTRLVVVYVVFYAALLALWPWRLTRFLVPLIPFLFWGFMIGAVWLSRKRRWLRPVPLIVVAVFGLTALKRDLSAVGVALRCDRSAPQSAPLCYSDVQRAFFTALRYVRDSTPDTSAFFTVKEATFAFLTSHRAAARGTLDGRTGETMLRSMRSQGVSYVLLTPLRDFDTQYGAVLVDMCANLRLEREFEPLTMILRIRVDGESDAPDACAAVQRYARENGNWIGR